MRSKLSAMTARTPSSFGPLAAQSREEPEPYSLPARMMSGTPRSAYFDAGVEDGHLLAFGQQARDAAFGAGRELVAQAHVGEGAAHHDFVIAAARAVGVEVGRLDAVLGEVFSGGAVGLDGAGGRDVVGGDGVAEHGEHARAGDVGDGRGRCGHAVEVRRLADVGGVGLPLVDVAGGEAEALPAGVALGDGGVLLAEAFAG